MITLLTITEASEILVTSGHAPGEQNQETGGPVCELYQLAEKLLDLDDSLAGWRHKHVLSVERIIGNKRGTGGSAGASYLRSTLEKRLFPELWSLRTDL